MQYALINNKPVRAGDVPPDFPAADVGPHIARCAYCGEWVKLDPSPHALAWIHTNPADKAGCDTARAREQAELYAALGGGQ